MRKLILPYTMSLLLIGAAQSVVAGTVTIPNVFAAGTPARAADVNADFSAVATGVNGNAQNIATLQTTVTTIQSTPAGAVLISVAGVKVGSLFGTGCNLGPALDDSSSTSRCDQVVVIDQQGFFLGIAVGNGAAQNLYPTLIEGSLQTSVFYYDQLNCVGHKFLAFTDQWLARQGYVASAADPTDTNQSYYVQGVPSTVTVASKQLLVIASNGTLTAPTCSNSPPTTDGLGNARSFYAAIPNDPTVTGVPKALSGAVTAAIH